MFCAVKKRAENGIFQKNAKMLRYSVTVTVLQFLKSKIPKDSQDMALDHESH